MSPEEFTACVESLARIVGYGRERKHGTLIIELDLLAALLDERETLQADVAALTAQRTNLQIAIGNANQHRSTLEAARGRLRDRVQKQDAALRGFVHGYMDTLADRLKEIAAALGEQP